MQKYYRRQKHSHGHNGQDFPFEKQSEILRVSHGHHGQDFQQKKVGRRQKYSHGWNGHDFQCKKYARWCAHVLVGQPWSQWSEFTIWITARLWDSAMIQMVTKFSWKPHTGVQFLHEVSGDLGAFGDSKGGLQFENFAAVRAFGDVSMAPLPFMRSELCKSESRNLSQWNFLKILTLISLVSSLWFQHILAFHWEDKCAKQR